MPADLYCLVHAHDEELVSAVALCDGESRCALHAISSCAVLGSVAGSCVRCVERPHRAYFVVDHQPLCIRHAADAVFGDDDMGAHHMAHAAYLSLNAGGVRDGY